MKKTRTTIALIAFIGLIEVLGAADLSITKGQWVYVVIPAGLIESETSAWTGVQNVLQTRVNEQERLEIAGLTDWKSASLPIVIEGSVHDEKLKRRSDTYEVDIVGKYLNSDRKIRFTIEVADAADSNYKQALAEIIVPRHPSPRFNDENEQALKTQVDSIIASYIEAKFVGTLAAVAPEDRLPLLMAIRDASPGAATGVDRFKNEDYFEVAIGSGDTVYNVQQVTQTQRLARSISERAFPPIKAVAAHLTPNTLKGVKIALAIPYKDFTKQYSDPEFDSVDMYVPIDVAVAFAEFEITDQEMVDQSIVVLNESRANVDLTAQ